MAKSVLEHPLFKDDSRLQNCLRFDKDHVQFGDVGDFVSKIQLALITIDNLSIDPEELKKTAFLTTTRDAVRKYKEKRKTINFAYERTVDPIVGKMTIEQLDNDLLGRARTTTDPLTDLGEPARIQAVLDRERPGMQRIIDRSISLLRELRDAVQLRNEEPGKLLQFEARNPLVTDGLRRFCGMGVLPDLIIIDSMVAQYEDFQRKLPRLRGDQKPISFNELLLRFPANVNFPDPVTAAQQGGPNFDPAITDAPNAMFFTPRYRNLDVTQKPIFRGQAPAVLELIQLHEMGHFYFGFADGDPRGKPFVISKRFAQTYEFFSRQAVFRIPAP
jgi:hypothetical protein